MNRNLFLKEIKRNALNLIIWTIVITFLITVTMSVFRTFLSNQSKIMGMMSILPKEALQFKGISNFSDLLSVLGFYSVNNIIYMMVLGSIFAIVLGSNILLKEEYNRTAEYLLSRPLTRSEIYVSKVSIVFMNVFILNFITSLAGFISMELVKNGPFSISAFMILSLYTFLLNALFGSLGILISTIIRRAKPITTLSIGIVLILYFLFTLSKITESASKIGYITPFRFVDVNTINQSYAINSWYITYFIGLSALFIILSYRLYLKKDIYT